MWQSRYILEETLAYETPRVVVLSVCSLRYGESQSESYNRMTLDYMRPSLYKWKAVVASLGEGESPVTYVLPLLRYHTRISALTAEDWKYLFKTPVLSHNGYLMRCDTVPYTGRAAAGGLCLQLPELWRAGRDRQPLPGEGDRADPCEIPLPVSRLVQPVG